MSEFYLRRFARIWPPLLVCSIITLAVLHAIDTDFAVQRRSTLLDFVPSLTMTSPRPWLRLSHNIKYIDGAYWSLFVEARFYIYAAIIYRWSARDKFLRNYIIFASAGVLLATLCQALLRDEKWHAVIDGLFSIRSIAYGLLPGSSTTSCGRVPCSGSKHSLCLCLVLFRWFICSARPIQNLRWALWQLRRFSFSLCSVSLS